MKSITKVSLLITSLMCLSSCSFPFDSSLDLKSSSLSPSSSSSLADSISYSSSGSSSLSSKPSSEPRNVYFYALNDFHGACDVKNYEAGIVKVGSFFKEKGQEDNTLILNSGDMFQGSLVSSSNKGEFLTEVMNNIQFDAFSLGNHEFDWGQEYIKKNRELKDEKTGYKTPFLSSNIYKYDMNKKKVGEYASELGDKYVTYTLANGLKVGIIGGIGARQITSITSSYVDDLSFEDPVGVTKTLSNKLRSEEKCDVVVLDIHAGQGDLLNTGLTSISASTHKRYVDAVFCAHTHQRENSIENGVPFVQGGCNGQAYAYVNLRVDKDGNVTCADYKTPYTSSIDVKADQEIVDLYNEYSRKYNGREFICRTDGRMSSRTRGSGTLLPDIATEAIAWAAQNKGNGFHIDYALCNQGRDDLASGEVTYNDLYKSLPFDNKVYVIEVSGQDLRKEIEYNSFTRLDKGVLKNSSKYTIAVIDYLAVHRNYRRNYDYFPSFRMLGTLTDNGNEYTYREMTRDYLSYLNARDGKITVKDHANSLGIHNADSLSSTLNETFSF